MRTPLILCLFLAGCSAPVKHSTPSVAAVSGNITTAHRHSANVATGIKGIKANNAVAVDNITQAIKLLGSIK
jgi:hypothetical protein